MSGKELKDILASKGIFQKDVAEKLNMTKRPSVSEAKIKSIFNFIVYQEVLDSCICNMVC